MISPVHVIQHDAAQQGALGNQNQDGRWTPSDFTDIRVDEDYERFYRAQAASGKKLPPPLDNRTIYNELPQHMSQGLSVQAQAALAHRLQAGGVNGLNGGVHAIQLCITLHISKSSFTCSVTYSCLCIIRLAKIVKIEEKAVCSGNTVTKADDVAALCRPGCHSGAAALQRPLTWHAASPQPTR